MKNKTSLVALLVLVFAAGSLSNQWLSPQQRLNAWAAEAAPALPLKKLQELAEAFSLIKGNYVEDISQEHLMESALRGMVSELDPHSSYLNESDFSGFNQGMQQEEYGGVGTYIGKRDDHVEVISPIYDSPAQRAGIESGDLILKIDDVSTHKMELSDAVAKMRGKAGDVLVLEILPAAGGDPRTVELIREIITTPSVMSHRLENGYGYLRINRFQNKTTEDIVTNLNGMYEKNGGPLKGVVLDLRNNPGGFLDASIAAAAVFLPAGLTVVSDKGRAQNNVFLSRRELYGNLKNDAFWKTVPMVVLVNNGSASASEILAGAMQDHRRAVILGIRTYGKASVQTITPLQASEGKTALRLTIARYFTPLGRDIQARGIEPDIIVKPTTQAEEREDGIVMREENISGHLQNSGEEEEVKTSNRPPFIDDNDFQYDQAMLVLKAIGITAGK